MDDLGNLQVGVGADISNFERGMAQVQADLAKVAASADAAAGRYVDAQGRMRDASGKFVTAATLAAEAAGKLGGSVGNLSDVTGKAAASINGGLVSSFGAFDRAIKPLDAGIGRLGQGLKGVGEGLTTYVTLPLGLLAAGALASYGKLDQLQRGLNAISTQDLAKQGVTGLDAVRDAAQATSERVKELTEIAKAPGIGFEEAVQGDIRLRAVGISAQQSAIILKEFANAISLTGGGASELNSVTVQLGQLSAKGKVLAQDLRPIIEAAPSVATALKKLYGTVDSETISASLTKQGKSSQEFIATLTEELGKLPRVTGGFSNELENFKQGVVVDAGQIGASLNKAFNLQGLLSSVSGVFDRLTAAFTSLEPGTQKLVLGIGVGVAALGPLLVGFGAIVAAIPSVVAGFEVLGLASTAALGPIGIGAAAIAAGAYLIITNWDELVTYFTDGVGGQVFANLADSITNSIDVIEQAFSQFGSSDAGSLGGLISASGILKALFQDLTVGITSFLNVASGSIGAVVALLRGNLTEAANEGSRALYGLIDPLANVLGFTAKQPQSNPILVLSKSSQEFNAVLPQFANNLKLLGSVTAGAADSAATTAETSTKKAIATLKELNAELKAALEKRFGDAQAGVDTTADDANIARIRALIAEYKQLPGHVDAATKAIQKLRAELKGLSILDDVLAVPANGLDVIQRRIDLLNSGLKRLADAGVSPASAAFKAFAVESLTLQRSLDGIQASTALKLNVLTQVKLDPSTLGEQFPYLQATLSKELLDRPLLVPLKIQPPQLADTFGALQELSKSLADAGVSSATFGTSFDYLGARAEALKAALQRMIAEGVNPITPAFQQVKAEYDEATAAQERLNLTTELVTSGLSALGEALGSALSSGADVFKSVLNALLGALGDFAIQYGKTFLLKGVLDIAAGNVGMGIAELAGGTALIAGGAALKGLGGGGGGGGAASGGGTSSFSAPRTNYTPATEQKQPDQITIIHKVEMTQRGADLVGTLDIATTRLGRSVPTRRP